MKHDPDLFDALLTRRSALRRGGAAAGAFTGLGALLAACGGESQTAPSSQASRESTPDPKFSEITQALDAARATPSFTPPGPAFDASGAAGKHLFYLAITFNVSIVQTLYNGVKEAGEAAGLKTTSFDAQGRPDLYLVGMQQAIQQKADLILVESIQLSLIEEPLKKARAAGIKVVLINEMLEEGPGITPPDAQVAFDYAGGSTLDAQWIVEDAGAKDIDVVIFRAPSLRHKQQEAAIRRVLEQNCSGACRIKTLEVGFADFATRLPELTRTAMTSDPDVNYMIPVIDGMCLNIVPALAQAGAANRVKIATYNGTPSVLKLLKDQNVVACDVGGANTWEGWLDVDQALRVLTDNEPVPGESKPPNRLFDASNIDELDLNGPEEVWYDTATAKDGFKQLWGVA
jgi:ribose transport system substrate-binding protein